MKKMVIIIALLTGCNTFSYYNQKYSEDPGSEKEYRGIATFKIKEKDHNDRNLVLLALSGGGSRAAYFSAAVMFKLDKMGILKKVDLISSVSGGSITAAYYCISSDPSDASAVSGRLWEKESVKKLLRRNLIARWIGNWFWPHNFFKYWFTSYDRTDIMAQTLADNFFDRKYSGRDLKFSECNKTRPKLVINATLATTYYNGEPFTFTNEDFMELIDSNIDEHLVSRAVMASAAFPGAFQYNVLRNFYPRKDPDKLCELNDNESSKGEQYIHLFDGGIHDNLGVSSLLRVIYGSYNFKMCEFRNASSIPKLCTRIYNDGLRFKLYSPHCSIEWLNELLSRPDYYCDALKIINANPDIKSTIEIIKQDTLGYFDIEKYCGRMQEERNNPQSYGSLDYRMITDFQKLKIQKLNRRIIEALYPDYFQVKKEDGSIERFDNIYIILVDAYNDLKYGVDPEIYDPRGCSGRFIDSTLSDSFTVLLKEKRDLALQSMVSLKKDLQKRKKNLRFIHFSFEKLKDIYVNTADISMKKDLFDLYKKLNNIKTSLSITDRNIKTIDKCTEALFIYYNNELQNVKRELCSGDRSAAAGH